jgi:hypothetical protein
MMGRFVRLSTLACFLSLAALPVRAAELIMFEEAGCVWCVRWHAEIGPGYPHTDEGRVAPLRRHDIRSGMPADVILEQKVTGTPTFVLVDGGEEKGRITGYPGANFFYPLLDALLKRLPARPPDRTGPAASGQRDARAGASAILR